MQFGNEIKKIRKSKGFTLRQAALQSKVNPGYLSRLENGKQNLPKVETLERLAKGLRISKEEMFKLAGLEVSKPTNIEQISSNFINIPIIGEIACGEPITAEQNISGYLPVPADVVKNGNCFILNCVGNSMEPTVSNGSQVVIREQPDAENGQIAAILLEDENTATLKRIKKTKTSVILLPDNPEYEPIILNEDKRGRILGIAKMEMKRF
ncbi:XRE family transcriptional regulator [Fructilactobacillus sanfranciscensis]|uniref:helix-turn-helix domain-containing protein n=1 Tax=Fructilactobacillus sanfranciscensis TaxID=1625 RepID=UPI0013D5955A|nr:XRE family transcriptional regulator [Fructilactobacillus sanfranciscensis]NDR97390.1 XRE family transcriptional regulator [Fructilactobacillus sanfranciscensis]